MGILLYIPIRLYPGRHPLVQPPLLWVLGATGYRTTAVYNPKYDTTSTVLRNVETGVCYIGGRLMGQWGKTRAYPLVRYTPGTGYPGTPSLATRQQIERPSQPRLRTEARATNSIVLYSSAYSQATHCPVYCLHCSTPGATYLQYLCRDI